MKIIFISIGIQFWEFCRSFSNEPWYLLIMWVNIEQVANFRFVPVRHQLLYVNCFCLVDSAYLSWVKHQDNAPWKKYLTSLVSSNPSNTKKNNWVFVFFFSIESFQLYNFFVTSTICNLLSSSPLNNLGM